MGVICVPIHLAGGCWVVLGGIEGGVWRGCGGWGYRYFVNEAVRLDARGCLRRSRPGVRLRLVWYYSLAGFTTQRGRRTRDQSVRLGATSIDGLLLSTAPCYRVRLDSWDSFPEGLGAEFIWSVVERCEERETRTRFALDHTDWTTLRGARL